MVLKRAEKKAKAKGSSVRLRPAAAAAEASPVLQRPASAEVKPVLRRPARAATPAAPATEKDTVRRRPAAAEEESDEEADHTFHMAAQERHVTFQSAKQPSSARAKQSAMPPPRPDGEAGKFPTGHGKGTPDDEDTEPPRRRSRTPPSSARTSASRQRQAAGSRGRREQ